MSASWRKPQSPRTYGFLSVYDGGYRGRRTGRENSQRIAFVSEETSAAPGALPL